MKRVIATTALLLLASTLFAGPQFRIAGNALTPLTRLPESTSAWDEVILPNEGSLSGWHWEVILDRLGFGMHYGVRFLGNEDAGSPFSIDWKGDFFLSYHFFGGGALLDPFIEFGWGNVGRAHVDSARDAAYPDWEDKVEDGSATDLALYTYGAAGLALDLNGLLLGVRLAYMPTELAHPVPSSSVGFYELAQFEIGLFGGIAFGSHEDHRRRSRRCDW
ncbi:MAG: hypothetical protein ACOC0E_11385 [Spirochaetota bacterium]